MRRVFLPTRPLRDATRQAESRKFRGEIVSTHASLAGRDMDMGECERVYKGFYPRVPCGTRRLMALTAEACSMFLPTRPLRDATFLRSDIFRVFQFLPTRPLRDATIAELEATRQAAFLPTRPLRDATMKRTLTC